MQNRFDDDLPRFLERFGVAWTRLDERMQAEAEKKWREIYDLAFMGRPRLKQGSKADYEFQNETCTDYLIVPFTRDVAGTSVHVLRHMPICGYQCTGPLVPLGNFCGTEFFISPNDFSWTMVHTHEDHMLGGPYFIRMEWLR